MQGLIIFYILGVLLFFVYLFSFKGVFAFSKTVLFILSMD